MEQRTECSSTPAGRAPSPIRFLRGGSSSRRRARPRRSCGIPGTRGPARWPIWETSSGARCSALRQRTRRTTQSISRAGSVTRCVSSSEPRPPECGVETGFTSLHCGTRPLRQKHPQKWGPPDPGPRMRNRPGTASPVKGTLQQHLTLLPGALLLAVPMLLGAACAAIQRFEVRDTERMLVAAGFHMRLADTPESQEDLRSIPVPVKNSLRPTVTEFGQRGHTLAGKVGAQPSSLTIGRRDDPRPRCLGLRPRPSRQLRRSHTRKRRPASSTGGATAISRSPPAPSVGPPRLDRALTAVAGWRSTLVIVQPATVLAWHRQGFQLYWRWKSRRRSAGRPPLDLELRTLIRRMARENPTWGRRRIHLGYEVAEFTVAKYMRRPSPRPSATWRAFLEAHICDIVAVDFFVVPTLTFHLLFAFLILRHHRRELVHVNVTDPPPAAWAAHH